MQISAHLRSSAPNLAIAACAASAGAHAALTPEHLRHAPALGFAFAVATAALAAAALALIAEPGNRTAQHAAALLLAALIGAYAASVTTGIPLLTETEPVDAVALATKGVEAVGAVAALCVGSTQGGRRSPATEEDR